MQFRKAYRFRLEPKSEDYEPLLNFCGCTRFVWNWMLDQRKQLYEACGKGSSYFGQSSQLKAMKVLFPWLKECPSQALQQSLKDLDQSFKNFFKGHAKFPNFKRKGQHDSFRIPQGIEVSGNRVKLPKLGWVKFRKSREIEGTIKNASLSRIGKHWYISMCCEVEMQKQCHSSRTVIGIDVGIARFATLSNNKSYEGLGLKKRYNEKIKRIQRSLSRKRKGSANWKKCKEILLRQYIKIGNTRKDHLHKVTTEISKKHAMIFVEDLKVVNMCRSAKGDVDSPGKNVKAKAGLNRSILDQSWGEFFRQLEYKQAWLGGDLHKVNPKHTSQKCSSCGHTEKSNRKTQSQFKCQACGQELNADLNAALNILAAGHAVLACGGLAKRLPMKQEPDEAVRLVS